MQENFKNINRRKGGIKEKKKEEQKEERKIAEPKVIQPQNPGPINS